MEHRAHSTSYAFFFLVVGTLMTLVAASARPEEVLEGALSPARRSTQHFDRNGDGVISREEFLNFRFKLFFGQDQDRPYWEAAARFAFAACDTDGNGELSFTELRYHPECGF